MDRDARLRQSTNFFSQVSQNPLVDPSLAHHLADLENYENINIPLFEIYKNVKEEDGGSEIIGGIKFSKRLTKNEEKVLKIVVESFQLTS